MSSIKKHAANFLKRGEGEEGLIITLKEIDECLSHFCGDLWENLEVEEIIKRLTEGGIRFDSRENDPFINKLNSFLTLIFSTSFFEDIDIFQKVILAINEKFVDMETFQEIDLTDIIYGLKEMREVIDMSNQNQLFSVDIKAYVAAVAKKDGLILLPKELEFAQKFLDKLNEGYTGDDVPSKSEILERMEIHIDELNEEESSIDRQVLKIKALEMKTKIRDKVVH